ncbi:BrnA antitoxin family protein [Yoonia sp. 2307UL14-13]|uniref:BrnA antitoxin family protein n=1 Tax=Yoonia sp. 2307UL14-13 TaxID=3126506 RepID=UPI0030B38DFC
MPRSTKAQRIARNRIARFLHQELMTPEDISLALRDKVPASWHTLEHDMDVEEPKVKVSLLLDQSVARFYRGMGKGYQARINRILALWAQMKIADALQAEKAVTDHLKMLNEAGLPDEGQ